MAIPLVDVAVDVRLLARPARAGLAIVAIGLRSHQHPAPERPLERDLMAAGVETPPTPVVVGVPRVRGEHEQHAASSARGPHHETGVPDPTIRWRIGHRQFHQVEPAPPAGIDRDLDADIPLAAVRIGGHRGRLLGADQIVRRPDRLELHAPAPNGDIEPGRWGRHAQADGLTRRMTELLAVPLDRVVVRDGVGHRHCLPRGGGRRRADRDGERSGVRAVRHLELAEIADASRRRPVPALIADRDRGRTRDDRCQPT